MLAYDRNSSRGGHHERPYRGDEGLVGGKHDHDAYSRSNFGVTGKSRFPTAPSRFPDNVTPSASYSPTGARDTYSCAPQPTLFPILAVFCGGCSVFSSFYFMLYILLYLPDR